MILTQNLAALPAHQKSSGCKLGGTRSSCNSLGNYGLITLLSSEAAHLLAIGAKNKILRRLIYRYTVVSQNFVWNTIQLHNNLPIFKFIWSWATWHHFANKCVKGEEVPYLEKMWQWYHFNEDWGQGRTTHICRNCVTVGTAYLLKFWCSYSANYFTENASRVTFAANIEYSECV